MRRKTAFTLAETLITLMVIGIVAAFTVPNLMQNVNEYTLAKQRTVFEKKFAEGLRQMRIDEKLAQKYESTADFITEVQKYFKISAVCDRDNLSDCFADTFTASASLNEEETASKTFTTSNIHTSKNLVNNSTYDTDVMGVIFADGAKMLITYDTDCTGIESGDTTGNLYSCFGYVADVNSQKAPNKTGYDIITNLALIHNFGLSFEMNDNKIYSFNSCDGDKNCLTILDTSKYWDVANDFCISKGASLPSMEQIADIAEKIYGVKPDMNDQYAIVVGDGYNSALWQAIRGADKTQFRLLTNQKSLNYGHNVESFCFNYDTGQKDDYFRGINKYYVLCVK